MESILEMGRHFDADSTVAFFCGEHQNFRDEYIQRTEVKGHFFGWMKIEVTFLGHIHDKSRKKRGRAVGKGRSFWGGGRPQGRSSGSLPFHAFSSIQPGCNWEYLQSSSFYPFKKFPFTSVLCP
jgi:hypothetical protein